MARIHLSKQFLPISYSLSISPADTGRGKGTVIVTGKKVGRPSRRITLHQSGLKITGAKITFRRRNIDYSLKPIRINHVNSFQEVRLHTKEMLYPGDYEIEAQFTSNVPAADYKILSEVGAGKLKVMGLRKYLPCIDEAETRENSNFNISYTDSE